MVSVGTFHLRSQEPRHDRNGKWLAVALSPARHCQDLRAMEKLASRTDGGCPGHLLASGTSTRPAS